MKAPHAATGKELKVQGDQERRREGRGRGAATEKELKVSSLYCGGISLFVCAATEKELKGSHEPTRSLTFQLVERQLRKN